MSRLRRAGITVGAPAVVVLATMVNAAASGASCQACDHLGGLTARPTDSVSSARVYLAQKAATAIHSADRLCGAQAVPCAASAVVDAVQARDRDEALADARSSDAVLHSESTHQHSAP